MTMRTANWVLLGIGALLIVGCGVGVYDLFHDTTYTLHYDGFTVEINERGEYCGLDATKVDEPDRRSPLYVRIKADGPQYPVFDLPEEYLAKVWTHERGYDNRPRPGDPNFRMLESDEVVVYPLSTSSEYGKQLYYQRHFESRYDSFRYENGELESVSIYDTSIRFPFETAGQCRALYGKQEDIELRLGPPKRTTSRSHLVHIGPFH